MGYSPFVELGPPAQKQGKCAETDGQKAESGTPLVEEDPGWSLLELISRRPGRAWKRRIAKEC